MTKEEFLSYFGDVDEATKAQLATIADNAAVANKFVSLRQQRELDAINSERQQLAEALDGLDPQGNPKGYRAWYNKNFPEIQKIQDRVRKYEEKYGTLEAPKPDANNPNPPGKQYTDEEIQRLLDTRFQEQYAPKISSVLKSTGRLVQKHMLAGRKTELDLDAIEDIMNKRPGMSIDDAYNEWAKPELEKERKAATDAEVERRVQEELQKRGSTHSFPGGADMDSGPGVLARTVSEKFDRNALMQDLATTYVSGKAPN